MKYNGNLWVACLHCVSLCVWMFFYKIYKFIYRILLEARELYVLFIYVGHGVSCTVFSKLKTTQQYHNTVSQIDTVSQITFLDWDFFLNFTVLLVLLFISRNWNQYWLGVNACVPFLAHPKWKLKLFILLYHLSVCK